MTQAGGASIGRRVLFAGAAALGLTRRRNAVAADYPTRPVSIVVAGPPGGTTDFSARLIAAPLGERPGVPVIVENRAGGNGLVGVLSVIRAQPDGHVLLLGYCANLTGRPVVERRPEYDSRKDLAPVALLIEAPQVMMVHPSIPARTLAEFIAYARQHPGRINYASSGNGSMQHLGTELLKNRAGIDLVHVPYRGTGETMNDVLAGRIQFYMTTPPPALPFIREGKLHALAMASSRRHPSLPEVPTAEEAGLPGFSAEAWFGLFAPRGTPPVVIARLTQDCRAALEQQALQSRILEAGAFARYEDPATLAARIERELQDWAALVRAQNIQPD